MRVLFVPAAAPSHYFPMAPLAWAFRLAGHEVCVAGQPPVLDPVVRSGMTAVAVGGGYDLLTGLTEATETVRRETGHLLSGSTGWDSLPADVRRRYGEMRGAPHVRTAEDMADDLVALARGWRPDLMVTDPLGYAAALAAETAGVPLVHHLWGPQPPSLAKFPGFGAAPERWPEDLLKLFGRFGAEPRAVHSVCTVDPCPPSLQPHPVPRQVRTRYLSYNGSGRVPQWLLRPAARPRICVSWMTTNTAAAGLASQHPVSTLVTALVALDAEVVAVVRPADRERIGPVPEGVRLVTDLPLHTVVAGCDAAVNHGGAGTMLTAACHGVPQVVVPQEAGLVFNAECLAATGAGVAVPASETDPERIAAGVAPLLHERQWREAARRLRAENAAQPAPSEAIGVIQEFM
ncbi:nucleotide disphospho-sugar-binding domain-containing protein [Streptomyces cyanogenus]|uniref:Desosaminyl transferase EryCIII n=1 Tax=Streptomyces cyanogenus TaxID=80860 RepID=A0ABX7TJE3_STRCY|nr:nucleotide disphospho-sugar-binding domain-containing protein [Streptomyces cyanogenus]QTD96697.1 Desosaminyl transferase EryCIII precursor [Streptomyces cyanogenus]